MTFACLSMKDLVDILKIRISHKSYKGTIPREIQRWDDSSLRDTTKVTGPLLEVAYENHTLHFVK